MSMNISNYSQFYRGTEKINPYGSAPAGGKDTLVRYEFNTTDENGNKIMDKMSREETMQAMKEISSQYGDNVIVEFSGDGMAMLAEAKKGQLDEIVGNNRAEKQVQFNNDVVQLQDTYRKVEGKVEDSDDFHSILKANDPELAKQVEEMNMRIINHKPGDASNAADFNNLMKKAMGVVNAAKERDAEITKSKSAEDDLSDSAKELLGKLRKEYSNTDFYVLRKDSIANILLKNCKKDYSVMFSAEEWEKMATDADYAKKKIEEGRTKRA